MTDKSKLDEDFDKFNLKIERAAEAEIARLRGLPEFAQGEAEADHGQGGADPGLERTLAGQVAAVQGEVGTLVGQAGVGVQL